MEKYHVISGKGISYGGKIYYCNHVNWFDNRIGDVVNLVLTIIDTYKLCKKNKYDVIHCQDSNYSGDKLLGAKLAGVKKRIAHSHVIFTKVKSRNPIKEWIKNILLTKMTINYSTDRLSCSNAAGKSIFKDATFASVLNPVDVDYFRNMKKKEHSHFNMLQIGYYCQNKNQMFSIELLKKIRTMGIDAHLHFIGFPLDKFYYEKIRSFVETTNLKEFVHFIPHDVDKNQIFPLIDVSLLPSFQEGFSITAVESQCANIPCVVSDVVVDDVDIGALYKASLNSEKAWIEAILKTRDSSIVVDDIHMNLMQPVNYANNIDDFYTGR